MSAVFTAIGRWLWRAQYMIEEDRQRHAAAGRVLREAWSCLLLALLRGDG